MEQNITDVEVWQALHRELWLSNHPHWFQKSESGHRVIRWIKKWLLRIEEKLVPTPVRRWLWVRKSITERSGEIL